jgi:hypothetical protein
MGDCPIPFGFRTTPPSEAPSPVLATVQLGGSRLRVDFDRPLAPNPALNFANWTYDYNFWSWTPTNASSDGVRVTINAIINGPGGAANECSYSPPPADVTTIWGVPAAAFANFPIT